MSLLMNPIKIVIDGNEANTLNRVGSNVYAFEILKALEEITRERRKGYDFTILLSHPPVSDLPPARTNWNYETITPAKMWTQWAEPLYLSKYQKHFEVFYTPGHYAPRACSIPYVTSVMDLAFLEFPEQFKKSDLIQLKSWTKYSVKKAQKVIAISKYTKSEVIKHYKIPEDNVIVAPPGVTLPANDLTKKQELELIKSLGVGKRYYLYVGTIQPRKNLVRLITAFNEFLDLASQKKEKIPADLQLVIAGKVGWLADETLAVVKASPYRDRIILPGFVSEEAKMALLRHCLGNYNLGLYEGFGIPALEALALGAIPVVANNTSLPEVVGGAGILIDPYKVDKIVWSMRKLLEITPQQREVFLKHRTRQLNKFSYEKSALVILGELRRLTNR